MLGGRDCVVTHVFSGNGMAWSGWQGTAGPPLPRTLAGTAAELRGRHRARHIAGRRTTPRDSRLLMGWCSLEVALVDQRQPLHLDESIRLVGNWVLFGAMAVAAHYVCVESKRGKGSS